MSRPRKKQVLLFRSTLIASGANADARAASGLAKIAEELEGGNIFRSRLRQDESYIMPLPLRVVTRKTRFAGSFTLNFFAGTGRKKTPTEGCSASHTTHTSLCSLVWSRGTYVFA